jgi:hypothetical protein
VAAGVEAPITAKVLVTTTVAVAEQAVTELQQVLPFLLAFLLL